MSVTTTVFILIMTIYNPGSAIEVETATYGKYQECQVAGNAWKKDASKLSKGLRSTFTCTESTKKIK